MAETELQAAYRAARVIGMGIFDLIPARDDLEALIAYCQDLKGRADGPDFRIDPTVPGMVTGTMVINKELEV